MTTLERNNELTTPERHNLPGGWYIIDYNGMPTLHTPDGTMLWGCEDWDAKAFAAAMVQGEGMGEAKCQSGCKHYTGGEVRHHPHCVHYPESMSKMLDEFEATHPPVSANPVTPSAESVARVTHPYPEKIGVVAFNNGEYEVDIHTPNVPPNETYIRLDAHEAAIANLTARNAALEAFINRVDTIIPERQFLYGCSESAMRGYLHMIIDQIYAVKNALANKEADTSGNGGRGI